MSVPTTWQDHVDNLRAFLRDTAALNVLEQAEESTDQQLYDALLDTLTEINIAFLPATAWTVSDISNTGASYLSWNMLKYGATLQVLTSVGILSARNTLTYNDAGGVTVQDFDKYGRYVNYFNVLLNKYRAAVTNAKKGWNIESCYDEVGSEWGSLAGGSSRISNW